jgi:hypothetical protein
MIPRNPDNRQPQISNILEGILDRFLLIQILIILSFREKFHALTGRGQSVGNVPENHHVQGNEGSFDCGSLKELDRVVDIAALVWGPVVIQALNIREKTFLSNLKYRLEFYRFAGF